MLTYQVNTTATMDNHKALSLCHALPDCVYNSGCHSDGWTPPYQISHSKINNRQNQIHAKQFRTAPSQTELYILYRPRPQHVFPRVHQRGMRRLWDGVFPLQAEDRRTREMYGSALQRPRQVQHSDAGRHLRQLHHGAETGRTGSQARLIRC
jgi:hypothetical protein